MCIASTEPRGPMRCSFHARQGYEKARDTHASARLLAVQLNADVAALNQASVDTQRSMLAAQAASLDPRRPAHEREQARDQYEADRAAFGVLHGKITSLTDSMGQRALTLRNAHDNLVKKRAQFDATPEGIGVLSINVNQLDERIAHAAPSERERLQAERDAVAARRDTAEATMATEAQHRNGAWQDRPEREAWNAETDRWLAARAAADERLIAANTDADRAEARAQLVDAQARLRSQFERERFAANLRPQRAAVFGQASLEERAAWGSVASAHRRTISSTGEGRYEVTVFREVDGTPRSATIEVPSAEFDAAVQQAGQTDRANITRYPTTSQVMRYIAHGAAERSIHPSRQDYRAAGGATNDYARIERCHSVFESLFSTKEAA